MSAARSVALALVPSPGLVRVLPPNPEASAQATSRWAVIQPLLEYRLDPSRFTVQSFSQLVAQVAENSGVSVSMLYFYLRRFEADGLGGLANKTRADKGASRWAAQSGVHAELADLAAYAYLHEHLSKKMAWEILDARARQLGVDAPSYSTIRAYLENIPPAVKTLALQGRRKYDEIFAPYIRRGYTDFEANEIWVSDHRPHDVWVQNNLFDAKDRLPMRLSFTGIEDMRSRKFIGYAWSQAGSSRSIATCTRRALSHAGPGREFYCDNGLDFQKTARGAEGRPWCFDDIPLELKGIFARVGMSVRFCIKFHPQSKLIESANRTIKERFDRRFATYTGALGEHPERCVAALDRHKKLLAQGRADESDLPLASEFIRAAVAWIEAEYHETPKNVPGMDGLTPNQAFEQFRWKDQPPPPAPRVLAVLLTERTTRIVRNDAIEMNNRRYVGADSDSQRALHDRCRPSDDRGNRDIIIAFDPLDLDSLAAIDEDGHVFALLEPETFLRQAKDEETHAAIGASMRERQHRYHETRDQLNALSRRVRATGYIPQHEQMLRIGRLPIDIDALVVHRPQPRLAPSESSGPQNDTIPGQGAERLAAALLRRNVSDSSQS